VGVDGTNSSSINDYFGNNFSPVWWTETKWNFNLEIVEIIDREIENISIAQHVDYIERIKGTLSE